MTAIDDRLRKFDTLLNRRKPARSLLIIMLFIHVCLLSYSCYVHSPTLNEPGHLIAGLVNWRFGKFDVYCVNPPLVRMIAALPVIVVGYQEDWTGYYTGPGARPEFSMGKDFVAANGERSLVLFTISRWACLPFSVIGATVCYLWARDLYGRASGILACLLWCSSPLVLAHSALITTDAGAASLGVTTCYVFWRWLMKPTWMNAANAGVVLGLAELTKMTLIIFYPLWPIMWMIFRQRDVGDSTFARNWLQEAGMLGMQMFIGLCVLNFGYGFEGSFKQLKEFHFVSNTFNGAKKVTTFDSASAVSSFDTTNRFANSWVGHLPMPFPKDYLQGIDIQQRDFELGRPSYLNGEWRDKGWWYYYLYAALVKVPLGTWGIGGIALIVTIIFPHKVEWRNELFLLLPAAVIFVVISAKTGFSEHFRYVLPAFPLFFIWCGKVMNFCTTRNSTISPSQRISIAPASCGIAASTVAILCSWTVASSLWIYPHSLSYFNESVGGPLNGSKHLLGSNLDWGQDLKYLEWYFKGLPFEKNEEIQLGYFGYLSPTDLGLMPTVPWKTKVVLTDNVLLSRHPPRVFQAVSANLLNGFPYVARDGFTKPARLPTEICKQLGTRKPFGYAGYSILVFDE